MEIISTSSTGMRMFGYTHIVNDFGTNVDASIGRGLDDCADLRPCNEVRLSLRHGLRSGVSLRLRLGVDVDHGAGLGRSESVLLSLGVIDDLSGYPNASCRDELRRGHDLRACERLNVGHDLGHCCGVRDCGGHSRRLANDLLKIDSSRHSCEAYLRHRLSNGIGIMNRACDSLGVVVVGITAAISVAATAASIVQLEFRKNKLWSNSLIDDDSLVATFSCVLQRRLARILINSIRVLLTQDICWQDPSPIFW